MNAPAEIIRAEIEKHGPLSFARFMELALYHPEHGYYERAPGNVGRRGDFYTSVSVGPLFGELLAFQFARWAEEEFKIQNSKFKIRIVESGAHDGQLAADILGHLRRHEPEIFARLDYCIIEPSLRRQSWQRETLKEFLPTPAGPCFPPALTPEAAPVEPRPPAATQVHWCQTPASLRSNSRLPSSHPPFTVIFSNELLDAFPVRRLGWDASGRRWFEWAVEWRDENFGWTRLPLPSAETEELLLSTFSLQPSILSAVLPEGFTVELSPSATAWWAAAAALRPGKLVTCDYGLTAEQFFAPERACGTLRAYHRHHVASDALARPGEQDLTAHVNFTALQRAGEAAGLATETFTPQARFLTRLAAETWKCPSRFAEWTPARNRQLQTLIHPEHLGRPFQTLIQSA